MQGSIVGLLYYEERPKEGSGCYCVDAGFMVWQRLHRPNSRRAVLHHVGEVFHKLLEHGEG